MEEFVEEETLTEIGSQRINTALRNVNALLRLSTNLINFERADVYSSELRISEYELNTYMNEICNSFVRMPISSILILLIRVTLII